VVQGNPEKRITKQGNIREMQQTEPSVSEIRGIFPDNLKYLCDQAGSVAQIARDLDINRAQFVRYLNGESSPRPEILEKICRYFEVDARILLEPLSSIRTGEALIGRAFDQAGMDTEVLKADATNLPDGFYKYWKIPFSYKGGVYVTLSLVHTRDGVRQIKTMDHRSLFRDQAVANSSYPHRRCDGLLFSHPHGHSFLLSHGRIRSTIYGYLENSFGYNSHLFNGFTTISHPQHRGVRRASKIVFEQTDFNWQEALAFAREEPYWAYEDVHPAIREYLGC